ncbi:NADPH:quinone reductase-like Zn-dependent oxidoreductase [Paenibacillus turicensis]|uniref:NADPH:quinone reductase-like Zn-dependent oxidoreductase n=1 Tax=Paenibacillus turicensis TaxID=160487 RepID=A0ABS4FX15_9BACL|nr:NADPH:quinone reductase-like Zn-dependent oxidoreductase [Paenibacillus turicensis]
MVTGATGSVGGAAMPMLHKKGYQVVASTGNLDAADYLKSLGASEQQWQAAVDPVGGNMLAAILSKIEYGDSVRYFEIQSSWPYSGSCVSRLIVQILMKCLFATV